MLGNRAWATFTFFTLLSSANEKATPTFIEYTVLDLDTGRSHHHLHVVVGQVHANVSHRQLQLLPVDVAAPVLHITSCSHQNSAPSSMTAANKWSKNSAAYRLIDWVVVLHPTRHKINHFGDVSRSQSLGLVWKKTEPNTTKGSICRSKQMYYNTK